MDYLKKSVNSEETKSKTITDMKLMAFKVLFIYRYNFINIHFNVCWFIYLNIYVNFYKNNELYIIYNW